MKNRTLVVISLLIVTALIMTGMTACTRAKPIPPAVSEAPTSVPGVGADVPTLQVVVSEPSPGADAASGATPASAGTLAAPSGAGSETAEVAPLILEAAPTSVPGMPTPTTEGVMLIDQLTPAVTLIIPLTPEVELPPTATPAPQTADGRPGYKYTVQENDTLFSISVRFGTSIEEIMAANDMISDLLSVGQELILPVEPPVEEPTAEPLMAPPPVAEPAVVPDQGTQPMVASGDVYVVQPGDNLFRIALQLGVSMDAIAQANNIVPPWYVIYTGQQLVIPQ